MEYGQGIDNSQFAFTASLLGYRLEDEILLKSVKQTALSACQGAYKVPVKNQGPNKYITFFNEKISLPFLGFFPNDTTAKTDNLTHD